MRKLQRPPVPAASLRTDFVFTDVEASSLINGFPIEVAFCDDGLNVSSWLIRPHETWSTLSWDEKAQEVHGLSQAYLQAEGLPAEQVAAEVAERLQNVRFIWSDNPSYDHKWLMHLVPLHPSPIWGQLLIDAEVGALMNHFGDDAAVEAWIERHEEISELARASFPHIHRAGADSLSLAARFRLFADETYFRDLKSFVAGLAAGAP